jgi:hypothetical protein
LIILTIFWIGIGFAEEAILLCKQVAYLNKKITLRIIGIELHEMVVTLGKSNVEKYECSENISITCLDLMQIKCNEEMFDGIKVDIVYTSAAFMDLVGLKLIFVSMKLEAVLLCSENTAEIAKKLYTFAGVEKCYNPVVLAYAELYNDNNIVPNSSESRKIYLVKYPHTLISQSEIYEFTIANYVITSQSIRCNRVFMNIKSRLQDVAEGILPPHIEDGWTMKLNEETPSPFYSMFIEELHIPKNELSLILNVYQNTQNDRKRNDACNNLSEYIANEIGKLIEPKILCMYNLEDIEIETI